MAKLHGTSLLPPAFNQPEAGKQGVLLCTFTGSANPSQQTTTSGTFVIAAVGSTQTVPLTNVLGNIAAVNNILDINDGGGHHIIGQITALSASNATVKTLTIVAGAAGNTMASGAVVDQATNASFVAAAVGSNQAVQMASATQAALFVAGDSVTISDGTTTIVGTVASQAGSTLNVTTNSFSAGAAGNTVATNATITSTSGDRIFFDGDPLNFLPAGAIPLASQIIVPGSTGSLAASVGYASQDGDITTTNATNYTYFNSATSSATAGRYAETSLNAPIALPKPAWPVLTFTGAIAPNATYTLRIPFVYPGPPAAVR